MNFLLNMSQNYYRQKKYRQLKKLKQINNECVEKNEIKSDNKSIDNIDINEVMLDHRNEESINLKDNNSDHCNNSVNMNNSSCTSDSDNIILCDDGVNDVIGITEKIRQWTLDNLDSLRLNVVTDLLRILREEGHSDLPKTAQTLLGTKHHRILQQMHSIKDTCGEYIYIGIEHGLNRVIDPDIFIEKEISVLVHIDGVQIYNNSQIQVWPILVKIFHENYVCEPFVVALYCGDSKPLSAFDYLNDFVTEANKLINEGVIINRKIYSFRIIAIIADSPARAFIKCIKSPGAFYACERCTIKGIIVGEKLKKKVIYPQIDNPKRTKESFQKQNQVQHHKENLVSPLVMLSNFDIINNVVLDSMHLLYLGVMKYLMENWTLKKSIARLKRKTIRNFRSVMLNIT